MNGPSEKAAAAAIARGASDRTGTLDALAAAHDPALGLDRSVCLRDVFAPLEELMVWADRYDGEIAGRVRDWMREFVDDRQPR